MTIYFPFTPLLMMEEIAAVQPMGSSLSNAFAMPFDITNQTRRISKEEQIERGYCKLLNKLD